MIKPSQLHPGDRVAIVSLSSGILGESTAQHQLALGLGRLKLFDLTPVIMPNALKGVTFLKHHPKDRAADLKTAFADDLIQGIICAIGGDDTYRLLPYLLDDQEFIQNVKTSPKLFTGFSDTMINHLMFYRLGMTSFYGPNFLNDLAELNTEMLPYTKRYFTQFFKNDLSVEIKSSHTWYEERTNFSSAVLGTPRISHTEDRGYEVLRGTGIVELTLYTKLLKRSNRGLVSIKGYAKVCLIKFNSSFSSCSTSPQKANNTLFACILSCTFNLFLSLATLRLFCIINHAGSFKGGGWLFPYEVMSMGSWNKSWKGFTVNERLPGAFVDVAVRDVFNSVAQLYRPAQIKKPPCSTLVGCRTTLR